VKENWLNNVPILKMDYILCAQIAGQFIIYEGKN
jgi:hypothetical protein